MDLWLYIFAMGGAVVAIALLARLGILERLNQRPAIVLSFAIFTGILWTRTNLPTGSSQFISAMADLGLAGLVFGAGLQFRISRLRALSPVAFTLSFFASPLFLLMTAPSAFVLVQGLTFSSAILLGTALMLNGSVLERRAVTNSASPDSIKKAISLESAAAMSLGLPLALLIEAVAMMPMEIENGLLFSHAFALPAAIAIGGATGLLVGRLRHKKLAKSAPQQVMWELATIAGLLFVFAPLLHASPIVIVASLTLFWSEEAKLSEAVRRNIRRQIEMLVVPVAYVLFGLVLGARLLDANALVLIFVIASITILRVFPRFVLLQRSEIPKDHKAFVAWFGGAPGVATALFLLHLISSTAIVDQEPVLVIGVTSVFVSVLAIRISAKPLANHFARQARISMKRRWYQRRSA